MEEPKGFVEAAEDVNWRSAMVEELIRYMRIRLGV
jgi:hypothetical protein